MSNPPNTAVGPYSPIREVNGTFYVSGSIGINADKIAAPDVAGQTTQVFENLKLVLASVGLTLDDVIKTTVFLTDMGDFATMNDVYVTMFRSPRPARSCVGVAELPRVANSPLKVEIEAIAVRSAS